jgi:hypothetical protein
VAIRPLAFFSQNAHITYFILFLKKSKTKNKKPKKKKEYAGVVRPSQHISFFAKKIKYVIGAFWEKRSKWSNCHNLKVWGNKVSHLKLWRQKCKSVDTSGGKV